ncbi:shikimate kinase [Amaricoccus macauensis]|uniref:Shikimate kinase n=1 Tax=Amaricoccus macauensis TaxID=57001 RepID=A0A840SNX7_9RHOB|nr:shikimate kinase [Amaricoccus macauensis]MBB5222460.1 shikimate kinase [Amaricoccus macauensis]
MSAMTAETRPGQPKLRRTIVLVGLMGAGKTSVGKRLAALFGVGFADSDVQIEEAAGMTIPEIFSTFGEPAFRDGERRVISRLLAERPGVLATGGGSFIDPRTRAEIRTHGTSVWLRADVDLLYERVRDRPGRPLLQVADPRAVLVDLNERRSPFYAEADITVDCCRGYSPEAMARRVVDAIRAHDRSGASNRGATLEEPT